MVCTRLLHTESRIGTSYGMQLSKKAHAGAKTFQHCALQPRTRWLKMKLALLLYMGDLTWKTNNRATSANVVNSRRARAGCKLNLALLICHAGWIWIHKEATQQQQFRHCQLQPRKRWLQRETCTASAAREIRKRATTQRTISTLSTPAAQALAANGTSD